MTQIVEGAGGDNTDADWIPSDADFGSRLAAVRHRMGWNVKEAARECGLPAASWRLWEVDGALPRNIVTIAMAIANRTRCDYLWLVHGPDRGGRRATNGYPTSTRIVRTVGLDDAVRRADPTRPVRQTRPVASRTIVRPSSPVAA